MDEVQVPQVSEEEVRQKELEIERKHNRFKFFMSAAGVVLAGIIVISLGVVIFNTFIKERKPSFEVKPEEKKPEEPVQRDPVTKDVFFQDDSIKMSFVYQDDAKIVEKSDNKTSDIKRIAIYKYSGNAPEQIIDDPQVAEQNLASGYVFKITRFLAPSRNIDQISQVKLEAVKTACPSTAIFSEIDELKVSDINSRQFEVKNCDGDYKITFVPRFYSYYEIVQLYKGDIGYKQAYKQATEEIMQSLVFFPEDIVADKPEDPYVTLDKPEYGFRFRYPRTMKLDCCQLSQPISTTATKVAMLKFFQPSQGTEGFNVYVDSFNVSEKETYEGYVQSQKNKFSDEYLVAKGAKPNVKESEVTVGSKTGTMFEGISWKGHTLIFVKLSDARVMMISHNIVNARFKEEFVKSLEGWDFYNVKNR